MSVVTVALVLLLGFLTIAGVIMTLVMKDALPRAFGMLFTIVGIVGLFVVFRLSAGSVFFLLMSALATAGAIVTVSAKNPIRGAVGLLFTIAGIAGLFVRLSAEFMAAIQLIVYAGAVVVLFVFVIMLLGPDASAVPSGTPKARASRIFAGVFMVLIAAAAGIYYQTSWPRFIRVGTAAPEFGSVEMVGRQLFTRAIVPFELATALLIVAVIGAIAVARTRHRGRPRKAVESPVKMFHGPLIARDAQRPLTRERAT